MLKSRKFTFNNFFDQQRLCRFFKTFPILMTDFDMAYVVYTKGVLLIVKKLTVYAYRSSPVFGVLTFYV